ncbi:MAG: hypothetical protein AABM43_02820 [Actinomycetota bacterium]
MKKFAATVIAGVLLAAVPAIADQTSRSAPATDGFLTIGGPKRLAPQTNLRVPIRCSVGCNTTAKTKLTLPDKVIGPDKATGHLAPGSPKNLIVTLNDSATEQITNHPNSRLRVGVTAISDSSGEHVHAVKVFQFTSTTP